MIRLYHNWYQLNDNNLWDAPLRAKYDAHAFRLLCLGDTKARIVEDTVLFCNCASGYKLKLSQHSDQVQNQIIDVLTPYLL